MQAFPMMQQGVFLYLNRSQGECTSILREWGARTLDCNVKPKWIRTFSNARAITSQLCQYVDPDHEFNNSHLLQLSTLT